jgi:hypothetical protein
MEFRLTLDGIQLIKNSQLAQRTVPQSYIDHEIDRTFSAAARALPPIGAEEREGTLEVRGREPRPLRESHAGGAVTVRDGDNVASTADADLDEDRRFDLLERVAAWNDILRPGARKAFAQVRFTGGALVGAETADRMEADTLEGEKRVYFIHLDTGRLLRVDLFARAWARTVSLVFSDWRTAGGLFRPYRVEVWDTEKESLLQTIRYEAIRRA